MGMSEKLLAIGGVYVDLNAFSFPFGDEGLRPETETVGGPYESALGGSAANFSKLSVQLGVPTAFIGKRGDDMFGEIMKKYFDASGIEQHLLVDKSEQTNIGVNLINDEGKVIMEVVGSANQALSSEEVLDAADDLLSECSYVMIGGYFKQPKLMSAYTEIINRSKDRGVHTVLDHARLNPSVTDQQKEDVQKLAKEVSFYLPSRDEFLELWGVSSIEEGLRDFVDTSVTVVVKDSTNGAWTLIDDELVNVPSFNVEPIHVVGAGDSFNAGFIAAQTRGLGLYESIRYGCATAALKISNETLPTRNQVDDFLAL